MLAYVARRLLLMIPTLFGILALSFVIVQFAPGGPVERVLAQMQGQDFGATSRFGGGPIAPSPARGAAPRRNFPVNIAARRGSIPNSSPNWKSNSASTSRRSNASG